MALKILLVLPIREGANFQITPDLGILYLGTVLRNQGYDVTLLDCPRDGYSFKDFKSFIREGDYQVVGLRCYSRDHNYVKHHLKIIRQVLPKALTLVGGPHPSALPEYVMASMPSLDYAWKAEAEEGFPKLLDAFREYGHDIPSDLLRELPGLVWKNREEDRIVVNEAGFGMDLDSFGVPAWEMTQPEKYPGFIWEEYYPIYTTRGCPYPCTYCNAPQLSGKKLRHRSVGHVIEELELLKNRYGIRRFSIVDDEFTLDRKYAIRLCEGLIDADLGLKWDCSNGVRLDSLDPDLLKVMEAAGCEALAVGIESGNQRIQELIKKKTTVDVIREKAAMIVDCTNIRITGYFMVGLLDETEEEIKDTIRLAVELPLRRANFNVVIPVPGTAIFDELLEEGRLRLEEINWDTLTSDQVAFERRHLTGRRLLQLQKYAYLRFYGRPRIVSDLAREVFRNREVLRASLRKVKMLAWRDETYSFTPMYLREKWV